MEEVWKAIPGYEGIYEASSLGRIRTVEGKTTYSKRHGVRHWKQRVLKFRGISYQTGYRVSLWKNGKSKDWLVARLVAMTFFGPSDLTVNHIDGNRFNNCVENLEYVSLAENIKKGFETGLYSTNCQPIVVLDKTTGEKKSFSSLSEAGRYYGYNHGYFSQLEKRKKPTRFEVKFKEKKKSLSSKIREQLKK